jgi:hypothetical protein
MSWKNRDTLTQAKGQFRVERSEEKKHVNGRRRLVESKKLAQFTVKTREASAFVLDTFRLPVFRDRQERTAAEGMGRLLPLSQVPRLR